MWILGDTVCHNGQSAKTNINHQKITHLVYDTRPYLLILIQVMDLIKNLCKT